jgi:outer membrane receptor protein involved in Fe transport
MIRARGKTFFLASSILAAIPVGHGAFAQTVAIPSQGQTSAPQPTDAAAPADPATPASDTNVGDIVVTAQRRSETLQRVPIAVSAFSDSMLKARQIEGGPDLQTGVPNMTFSKGSRGDNITIRGIGNKQITTSGDTTVGVHFNGAPLTDNRLFEADFYDAERIEVLRGPQGTLYGRNATGGVINMITAKPTGKLEGAFDGEVQNNYGTKLKAMVNVPIAGDRLALRVAGYYYNRNGFVTNLLDGDKIDGRNVYSYRATLGFKPTGNLQGYVLFSRFREDDDRLGGGKNLCVRDPGPASVAGTAVTNSMLRAFMSIGCGNYRMTPGVSNDTPNSLTSIYGLSALRAGLATGDLFAGKTQPASINEVESTYPPLYHADQDIYEVGLTWRPTPNLSVDYLGSYTTGGVLQAQDTFLVAASVPYLSTAIAPGGVVNDPQLGPSNSFRGYSSANRRSTQQFHEVRIASSFNGPFNFSVGANYLKYSLTQTTYIFSEVFTGSAATTNGGVPCAANTVTCIYIDPSPVADGSGHNYYRQYTPYHLTSKAVFGEAYLELAPRLKLTAGARYTWDDKSILNYPVKLLAKGSGATLGTPAELDASFRALTGRLGFDWRPQLSFTDSTLVYAFATRGYKGGGLNNVVVGVPLAYKPEHVNAFEIGTKNTLANGALTLNASAFFYQYSDYQISRIVNSVAITENADANIAGLELEMQAQPFRGFRINANGSLLHTKLMNGQSTDAFNRNQGDTSLTPVKNTGGSVCLVPTAALANLIAIIQQNPGAPVMAGVSGNPQALLSACSGAYSASLGVTPTTSVEAQLRGRELANAPNWTVTLGAEYQFGLGTDWNLTLRGDYYRQGRSWARIFNDPVDYLPGWANTNVSIKLARPASDLSFDVSVKNLFNNRAVTDLFFNDDTSSLLPRAFLRDARVISFGFSKKF